VQRREDKTRQDKPAHAEPRQDKERKEARKEKQSTEEKDKDKEKQIKGNKRKELEDGKGKKEEKRRFGLSAPEIPPNRARQHAIQNAVHWVQFGQNVGRFGHKV